MGDRSYKVLLIDDEPPAFSTVSRGLAPHGIDVVFESDPARIIESASKHKADVILLDIMFGAENLGLLLLRMLKSSVSRNTPVFMLTNTMADYPEEVYKRAGAANAFAKEGFREPGHDKFFENLSAAIKEAIKGESEIAPDDTRFRFVVGTSRAMKDVCRTILTVAPSDTAVLITGETGTGKELVARDIHGYSKRRGKPFLAENCAAFPSEDMLYSVLFGHEKGSFTGAHTLREGLFESAEGGTVFLDEIGDAPAAVQKSMLRVLQEKQIKRLGSSKTISVDVRIIAATNRNLKTLMSSGAFREDLYFRLNTVDLCLPSLRERPAEDLEYLFNHFVNKHRGKGKLEVLPILNKELAARFREYPWPGNIREFEKKIEAAIVQTNRNVLLPGDFNFATVKREETGVGAVVKGIMEGRFQWPYVKGRYKGDVRKAVITGVYHALRNTGHKHPTSIRIAAVFGVSDGNMRQILKDTGLSMKVLKEGE
jgi:DNA-binding NtrC family response regulator